ncbi:hypothetical protein D6D25_02151 [Aureobasidium pullulans]|nr:hypothetical protein D6D25_02151 [Aureobasidium pullulans]
MAESSWLVFDDELSVECEKNIDHRAATPLQPDANCEYLDLTVFSPSQNQIKAVPDRKERELPVQDSPTETSDSESSTDSDSDTDDSENPVRGSVTRRIPIWGTFKHWSATILRFLVYSPLRNIFVQLFTSSRAPSTTIALVRKRPTLVEQWGNRNPNFSFALTPLERSNIETKESSSSSGWHDYCFCGQRIMRGKRCTRHMRQR